MPTEFATQIRIQLVVAKFTNLLMHNMTEAASTSLIRLLDGELDTLKSSFREEDEHTRMIEYGILAVKLHFYALLMTRMRPMTSAYEIMQRTGLTVALRLIHISSLRLGNTPTEYPDSTVLRHQRCLPKAYYRGLAFAIVFLLKFFNLNGAAPLEEQQSAANHVVKALNVFKTCSTQPRDEYGRVVKFLEVMARLTPDDSNSGKPHLTHRLGVSILLETLGVVYEAQGRSVELDEDHTLHDRRPDQEAEMLDIESSGEMGYNFDQELSDLDFQGEIWNDPIWNMLSLDVGSSFLNS